jgi:hypothetical protein
LHYKGQPNKNKGDVMTEAGDRVMYRETKIRHIETGFVIIVSNSGIPVDEKQPSHLEQRNQALNLMSSKLGTNVSRSECEFDFIIVESVKA